MSGYSNIPVRLGCREESINIKLMKELNMKEKASVIIPVHNSSRWVEGIIKSINLNLDNVGEIILINDGELDDFEILNKRIKEEIRYGIVTLQTKGRQGPAVARNLGLDHASCEFIAFLDSDDIWTPGSLKKRISLLIKNNYTPFSYCSVQYVDENEIPINEYIVPKIATLNMLLVTNYIASSTVVIRRSFLNNMRFPLKGHEDYGLWLNILKNSIVPAEGMEEIGGRIRIVTGSISSNKIKSAKWHYNILKYYGLNFGSRLILFILYALNGIMKKKLNYRKPIFFGTHLLIPQKDDFNSN